MEFETLLTELQDGMLTITLNRPDRLNAYNHQMFLDFMACFDRSDADDDVRAIIITGAGRGFCAGADLGGGAKTFDGSTAAVSRKYGPTRYRWAQHSADFSDLSSR